MAMDDDTLTRPRSTLLPKFGKAAAIRPPVAETPQDTETTLPAEDDPTLLPLPGSPYDKAYGLSINKPVPTIFFLMGQRPIGLPYANFDSIEELTDDKPGASPAIVIRFNGLVPREAIIRGRHVFPMLDRIGNHRVTWVRLLPEGKDFKGAAMPKTVITGLTVDRITKIPT